MFDSRIGEKALVRIYDYVMNNIAFYESGEWAGCPMELWNDRDWQGVASHAINTMYDQLGDEELSGIIAFSTQDMSMKEILGLGICSLTGRWLQVIYEFGEL